jgi:hypothetical protein
VDDAQRRFGAKRFSSTGIDVGDFLLKRAGQAGDRSLNIPLLNFSDGRLQFV